jgi:integrase
MGEARNEIGKGNKQHFTAITPTIKAILDDQAGHHPIRVFTFVSERTMPRFGYTKGHRYPINYDTFGTWWARRVKTNQETAKLRIHDARHTFGQNFQDANHDVRLTQRVMGHGDVGTTMRYLEGMTDPLREAMVAAESQRVARRKSVETVPTDSPTKGDEEGAEDAKD